MTTTKTLYYPVWISPGRRAGGWSWGKPCDTVREAQQIARAELANGATLACVVEMSGGEKRPLTGTVKPESARKIIRHWEELWDATE